MRGKFISLWLTGVAATAFAPPAAGAAGVVLQADYQIALSRQKLADSIRELATETGTNIIVQDSLVRGFSAPSLTGSYKIEAALALLLKGTGLSYRQVGNALVIFSPSEESSGDGKSQPAIVVTGSNLRGAPPTSPVITISRRDIDQTAPASVEELMRKLPQNLSGGVAEENFGVTGAGSDITLDGAGVNLRGLGQRATLVLVNGQRIAPSGTGSFVDVSLIPVSAIDRVEVLTDGASAIYGSDAVGGVVNFILRKDFNGLDAMVQAGTSTEGGGNQLVASATGGTDWRSGHAMLSYEFRSQGQIEAKDRDFTIKLPDQWSLFPKEKRNSVFGVIRQDISPAVSLELTGIYSERHTTRSYFVAGPLVPVDGDSHARTTGGTAELSFDLGNSWRTRASASYFEDRTREVQNQEGRGLVNRFNTRNSMIELALRADGTLIELPGGPAKLAVGALARSESFSDLFATQVNLPNSQKGSRRINALYGELNIPLVGERNRIPGFDQLVASVAGRVEHYERLGSSFNPKLGLLWSPASGLALRGSYATSFRAPLLYESLGLYNVYLFPASLLYLDPSSAPAGVGAALVGSNPDVKPERSKSFSAGVDWKPPSAPGLRFQATYYTIRFTNRIAFPSEQIVVVGNPALEPIVTHNPPVGDVNALFSGAGQVLDFSGPGFTNGGATASDVSVIVDIRSSNMAETRTSGLDLGLSYEFALGSNEFRFDLNANRVFRFDDRLTRTSPVIHDLNTPFHPVDWRARSGLSWSHKPWSAWVYGNFTDGYRDNRTSVVRPVGSFTTFDAGLSLSGSALSKARLWRNARAALVVQNLFDAHPPLLMPDPGTTKGIGYDPVNASGIGRVVSIQLRKTW